MELENKISQLMDIVRDCAAKKEYDQALDVVNHILKLVPNNILAWQLKAEIYLHLGDGGQVEVCLLQVITHDHNNINALTKLWTCYFKQKKYQEALAIAMQAREIDPVNIYALRACALGLRGLGRLKEALIAYKQAIVEEPGHLPTIIMLADLCFDLRKLDDAEMYYDMAYELDSNNCHVLYRLCYLLKNLFDQGEEEQLTKANQLANRLINITDDKMSVAQYIQSIALASIDLELQTKLGDKKDLLNYWADEMINRAFVFQKSRVETMQDRMDLLEAHKIWGSNIEASVNKNEIKHRVRHRLNNKIRLGITSPDFRSNHIGCYIWPLVENLDRDKFEIYCYSQWPDSSDPLQKKFTSIADGFKECPFEMSDKDIALSIADDYIDVLIETGVWVFRPKLIAYRPASLQISWLDYLHSMGEPTAVDYIVLDPYVKPESPLLLIEKPLILPDVWMVMHPYGFPFVSISDTIAEDCNGYITFGSMNSTYRLTEETFKVWAGIMKMVPNSRFIYIHPEFAAQIVRDNFYKNMGKYGVSEDRISFIATRKNFLEHFNKVDIVLDTFPHMGNTTTGYALWMGLPIVTLVGPCFFERVSYSALSNCGLDDLCAFSLQEYHDIALRLVFDKERRRYIHQNLRGWILNGPLGQPKQFADNMGNAIMNVLGRG